LQYYLNLLYHDGHNYDHHHHMMQHDGMEYHNFHQTHPKWLKVVPMGSMTSPLYHVILAACHEQQQHDLDQQHHVLEEWWRGDDDARKLDCVC
jgi:hypothetical protein